MKYVRYGREYSEQDVLRLAANLVKGYRETADALETLLKTAAVSEVAAMLESYEQLTITDRK